MPALRPGHNGGTHMSFEDMGIVRGLAHSVVLEVTDAVMFEDVLRQLINLEGFYWVRTIRKPGAQRLRAGLNVYHRQR